MRRYALLMTFFLPGVLGAQTVPQDLDLVQVTTALNQPLAIRNAGDGSNRLFIAGRFGHVWVLPPGASQVLAAPLFRIPQCANPAPPGGTPDVCVRTDFENGLLGIAFHPDYASNGFMYVNYVDRNDDTVIARVTVSPPSSNVADLATLVPILRIDLGAIFHRGGDLAFGPDGLLYIPMGDGANQGDPCNRAQTLTPTQLAQNNAANAECPVDASFTGANANPDSRALLGKVLRIDVDRTTPPLAGGSSNELCGDRSDGSAPYAIPPGNPYAISAGIPGACDEIYSYGWRNPWRFSIDSASAAMLVGDVGNGAMEEVSLDALAGTGNRDFGWRKCEGTVSFNGTCAGTVPPIWTQAHASGNRSVTGGYIYRGDITLLNGMYVVGDFVSGRIFMVRRPVPPATQWTSTMWRDTDMLLVSFGTDEAGELYAVDIGPGRVWRFNSAQTGVIFLDGFD